MSALIDHQNYLARADAARIEANSATLENVRERFLRAEAAWRGMAVRTERTLRMREKSLATKAAATNVGSE